MFSALAFCWRQVAGWRFGVSVTERCTGGASGTCRLPGEGKISDWDPLFSFVLLDNLAAVRWSAAVTGAIGTVYSRTMSFGPIVGTPSLKHPSIRAFAVVHF